MRRLDADKHSAGEVARTRSSERRSDASAQMRELTSDGRELDVDEESPVQPCCGELALNP
jgi:hypothetical protein